MPAVLRVKTVPALLVDMVLIHPDTLVTPDGSVVPDVEQVVAFTVAQVSMVCWPAAMVDGWPISDVVNAGAGSVMVGHQPSPGIPVAAFADTVQFPIPGDHAGFVPVASGIRYLAPLGKARYMLGDVIVGPVAAVVGHQPSPGMPDVDVVATVTSPVRESTVAGPVAMPMDATPPPALLMVSVAAELAPATRLRIITAVFTVQPSLQYRQAIGWSALGSRANRRFFPAFAHERRAEFAHCGPSC